MNVIPSILTVIPAYNEANRITDVVSGAKVYLPVLVVDDGSSDETADVSLAAGARVLNLAPNQGKGSALRKGFDTALDLGYEAVLTLDADGQHDPSDIPLFIKKYTETRADLVIGARDFSQMPPIRRLANTLGRITFSWAIGQPVPDNQSGYRLVSEPLMKAMLNSQEQGFEFEVEMIKVCIKGNFQLEWVPIRTIYADESSHISPLQHVQHFLRMVLHTRKDMRMEK